MTIQEMRIAIAEFSGFAWYARWTGERGKPEKYATFSTKPENHGNPSLVGLAGETFKISASEAALMFRQENHSPDYPNDLDAVHEAEERINATGKRLSYCHAIAEVVNPDTNNQFISTLTWLTLWPMIHATAPQRCEALCRTLWPERFK